MHKREGIMKKKILATRVKVNNSKNRPLEVNYIGNGLRSTVRYADTSVYDLYYFQNKINNDQYQSAEWLHSLAIRSNLKLSVQSFLSNPVRLGKSAQAGMSERSVQSKITLNEVLKHIKKSCGVVSYSLLQGIVIYNQSLSEWSSCSGKSRTGKMQMLQSALNEVGKFRGM